MSLCLTGTQDHSLLAMVVQEARRAAETWGGFVGRTAVQKMMYFLKATGVPMTYRFDIYHYGPFCEEILRDVEWLIADGVITDLSDKPEKYSNYAPGEAIAELLSKHEKQIEPCREHVRQIVRAFVPMRPERLELIATLDYLYRQRKASGGRGPWKPVVLSLLQQVKGDKFSSADAARTYDVMVNAGLVDP